MRTTKRRKVLVILSNRLNTFQKVHYVEIESDEKGNILSEHPLRREPKKPLYDEVWENDEGKPTMATCHRFKRRYRHRLEKPKA